MFYAWITTKLQKNYIESKGYINFYRVFVPIFSMYQIFLLRGDLLSSFSYLAPVVLFIFLGLKLKIIKKRLVLR